MIKNPGRLGSYQLVTFLVKSVEELTEQKKTREEVARQRQNNGYQELRESMVRLQADCEVLKKEIMRRLREATREKKINYKSTHEYDNPAIQ